MPNPASTQDIVERWQTLTEQQATNASARLGDAWLMLKGRLPGLEERIEDDVTGDLAATAVRVLADAVIRVLKNPDGFKEEKGDDYAYVRPDDGGVPLGVLDFTQAELDDLRAPESANKGNAFSINLLAGYVEPA